MAPLGILIVFYQIAKADNFSANFRWGVSGSGGVVKRDRSNHQN
jgi:hypothetical protein